MGLGAADEEVADAVHHGGAAPEYARVALVPHQGEALRDVAEVERPGGNECVGPAIEVKVGPQVRGLVAGPSPVGDGCAPHVVVTAGEQVLAAVRESVV